jgi:4-alpha-glucanotransferase
LISPDWLIEDGLLEPGDCEGCSFPANFVDYDAVIPYKRRLLDTASRNFNSGSRPDLRPAYEEFCDSQAHWLDDYALFQALKARYDGAPYLEWPAELVRRDPAAMACAFREFDSDIERTRLAQFLLFRQGERLKQYARKKSLRLIGDLPFFVSPDSSDVWANPALFDLDLQHRPRFVAGVPPDYFSAQGQRWGNPVYDWDVLRRNGYRWCVERLRASLAHVDVIRLDHFRAFAAAWHIPAAALTAQAGTWIPGPGADFFETVQRELGTLPFIAEDLGVITTDVAAIRDRYELPGMRVLQFAFNGDKRNPHLPDYYSPETVADTGTHDNNTTRGWFEELPENQKQNLWRYLRRSGGDSRDAVTELMRLAWSSPAALAMAPLQDVLNLGGEARMNVPGRADGNWRWRCTGAMLAEANFEWLHNLTSAEGRIERTACDCPIRHERRIFANELRETT